MFVFVVEEAAMFSDLFLFARPKEPVRLSGMSRIYQQLRLIKFRTAADNSVD